MYVSSVAPVMSTEEAKTQFENKTRTPTQNIMIRITNSFAFIYLMLINFTFRRNIAWIFGFCNSPQIFLIDRQ